MVCEPRRWVGFCVGFPVLGKAAATRSGCGRGGGAELGSESDGSRVLAGGGGVRQATIGLRNRGGDDFTVVSHLKHPVVDLVKC